MIKKNKRLFIIFAVIILLFLSANFALALEAKYPSVPGLPDINSNNPDLSAYIGYFFGLGMYLAGILALISFSVGAIQLMMAASSPETEKEGKDRMKGALLGLVLTLSAFIILRTINLSLINPSLTPLPGVAGVFYKNGEDQEKSAPLEEANTANIPTGFEDIYYDCSDSDIAPTLLIWEFPKTGFQGNDANYGGVKIAREKCGEDEAIDNIGSFQMAFETPGIYYFLQADCKGYMSNANTSTQDLTPPFAGNIKSVKIVNGNGNYYGAIFHESFGAANAGNCTDPILISDDSSCENLSAYSYSPTFSPLSADIFLWNHDNPKTTSSGDGLTFYSDNNGWNAGIESGKYNIKNDEIKSYLIEDASKIIFNWSGVNSEMADTCTMFPDCNSEKASNYVECCSCATFQDVGTNPKCSGSIQLNGNYLTALYTYYYTNKNNSNSNSSSSSSSAGNNNSNNDCSNKKTATNNGNCIKHLYCQTFRKDITDLKLQQFLPPGSYDLDHVDIIATK